MRDASYSGDANNNSISENSNTGEQVTVSRPSVTVTTTPNVTSVTLGTSVPILTDSATITSNGSAPVGTVLFFLLDPTGSLVDEEEVTVSGNNTYTTPSGFSLPTTGTVVGTYQWNADFEGSPVAQSDDNNPGEQVTVNPASPTLTTNPTPHSVTVTTFAQVLHDTATLSGGYHEGGTITFRLFNPLGSQVDIETVSVTGDRSYNTPSGFTISVGSTLGGTYQWDASYSGDANNNSISDNSNTGEQVTVTLPTPVLITTPNPTSVTLGTATVILNDTATLSNVNGSGPTGAITFRLFGPSSTLVDIETVTANGDGTYTTPSGFALPTNSTAVGLYQWDASYSGTGGSVTDNSATGEQVTVSSASPTLSTTPSNTNFTLGTTAPTLTDMATLSGGYHEGGSITFTLFNPSGSQVDVETVPVSGDGSYTTPSGFTLPSSGTVVGTYQWNASYSGDANNNSIADNSNTGEKVTIGMARPTVSTVPNPTLVTLGTSTTVLQDTATISGGYFPTGSIEFVLRDPLGSRVDNEFVTVTAAGTYSTPSGYTIPTGSTLTGTYQWEATFFSDANNFSFADNANPGERVTVLAPSVSLSTTPNLTSVSLGTASVNLKDTATLSNVTGSSPTGAITFTLYGPGNSLLDTETVTANGNGTYTTPSGFTLPTFGTVTGSYQWDASYSGTGGSATDNSASGELVTVSSASPILTTIPTPLSVTLGTASTNLKDTATLSGGYHEGGAITFTLYKTGSSTVLDIETVSVTGDATYTTPSGYTLPGSGTVTGTYQWNASYSGDANNNSTAENYNSAEQVAVSSARPQLATTPSPSSFALGTSSTNLKDTATLSGGYHESGYITFTLYSPSGSLVDTETVSVTGNSSYTTPSGYTVPSNSTATGVYQWDARYTGDGNNNSAADINDPSEAA